METPTWGYVIGILMLLIGGCSTITDIQAVYTPSILEQQKEMFKKMTGEAEEQKTDSIANQELTTASAKKHNHNQEVMQNMSTAMESMFYMSDFTKKWSVRFGYIGLFFSFIYILAGVFLLIRKAYSLKIVYSALGLYIIFNLIQIFVLSSDSSQGLLSKTTGYSNVFGIIVDVIILIVILSCDKSAYKFKTEKILADAS